MATPNKENEYVLNKSTVNVIVLVVVVAILYLVFQLMSYRSKLEVLIPAPALPEVGGSDTSE
jgi:hypothetical protein